MTHVYGLAVCGAVLLAIWPLPGTMALRNLMLLGGGLLGLMQLHWHRKTLCQSANWHLLLLPAFFIWLLVHLAFFSVDLISQAEELGGVWLRSFLAMLTGAGLGLAIRTLFLDVNHSPGADHARRRIGAIMVAGVTGTLAIYTIHYLHAAFDTGVWVHTDFYADLYLAKPPIVIFIGLFLPIPLIKLFESMTGHVQKFWIPISLLLIALSLLIYYTAGTKNGIALFVFVLAIFLIRTLYLKRGHSIKPMTLAAGFLLLLAPTFVVLKKHYDQNPAWHMLLADVRVGLDIDHQNNWKDHITLPTPINEYGVPVNGSTYQRTAWATAGIRILASSPLGYGLMDRSFSDQARQMWPDFQTTHKDMNIPTHSGWLDFALILGLPGLALLIAALWVPLIRMPQATSSSIWGKYMAIVVPMLTFGYLFTEVAKDIFIEALIFLTASFATLCHKGRPQSFEFSGQMK